MDLDCLLIQLECHVSDARALSCPPIRFLVVNQRRNRHDSAVTHDPEKTLTTVTLILLITLCYAAYNLLIKVSGNASDALTSPLLATICLQFAALSVSFFYLLYLWRSNASIGLPAKAYPWAIAAGVCIGLAEIMYFYLFRESGNGRSVPASVAIPLIVGGTILVVVSLSFFLFGERLNWVQWSGVGLAIGGLLLLAYG